eukprot:365939-Chlamydomonas_euryale.AAC.8
MKSCGVGTPRRPCSIATVSFTIQPITANHSQSHRREFKRSSSPRDHFAHADTMSCMAGPQPCHQCPCRSPNGQSNDRASAWTALT